MHSDNYQIAIRHKMGQRDLTCYDKFFHQNQRSNNHSRQPFYAHSFAQNTAQLKAKFAQTDKIALSNPYFPMPEHNPLLRG